MGFTQTSPTKDCIRLFLAESVILLRFSVKDGGSSDGEAQQGRGRECLTWIGSPRIIIKVVIFWSKRIASFLFHNLFISNLMASSADFGDFIFSVNIPGFSRWTFPIRTSWQHFLVCVIGGDLITRKKYSILMPSTVDQEAAMGASVPFSSWILVSWIDGKGNWQQSNSCYESQSYPKHFDGTSANDGSNDIYPDKQAS